MFNIDLSLILGIIGTVLTILFGILGIQYSLKFQKRSDLCIVHLESVDLYSSVINSIDGLTIEYNKMALSDALFLIKAAILNTGTEDIARPMIYEHLKVKMADEYNILNASVVESTPGVNPMIRNDSKGVDIVWDLLKPSEFIVLNVLVKGKTGNAHNISMHTKSRIQGIASVDVMERPARANVSEFMQNVLFIVCMGAILITIIFSGITKKVTYSIAGQDGSIVSVDIKTMFNKIDYIVLDDKIVGLPKSDDIKVGGVSLLSLGEKQIEGSRKTLIATFTATVLPSLVLLWSIFITYKDINRFFKNRRCQKIFQNKF